MTVAVATRLLPTLTVLLTVSVTLIVAVLPLARLAPVQVTVPLVLSGEWVQVQPRGAETEL